MQVRTRIRQSIGTGEVIGIIYHGGSQPGTFREITPIQADDEKVRAHCHTSHVVKVFLIEKIELRDIEPTADDLSNRWDPRRTRHPKFITIDDAFAALRSDLEALGWHVTRDTDEEGERIDLREFFKNGKLRKNYSASLVYQSTATRLVVNEEGELTREATGPRTRPWIVRSKQFKSAKTYADADKAIELFLEEARKQAPNAEPAS